MQFNITNIQLYALQKLGDDEKALAFLLQKRAQEKALEQGNPRWWPGNNLRYRLAQTYVYQHRYSDAKAVIETMDFSRTPASPSTLFLSAFVYSKLALYEQAMTFVEDGLNHESTNQSEIWPKKFLDLKYRILTANQQHDEADNIAAHMQQKYDLDPTKRSGKYVRSFASPMLVFHINSE